MKQWETTFNNNHLRLMRVHIGFVVFYFVLVSAFGYFGNHPILGALYEERSSWQIFVESLLGFMPIMAVHFLLAIGAKRKLELSRRISEIVFAIMLLGFPIGTILSAFYFLPRTIWKDKGHK